MEKPVPRAEHVHLLPVPFSSSSGTSPLGNLLRLGVLIGNLA